MVVKTCPKCGRLPKITDCVQGKHGTRRRMCGCPNCCSVVQNTYYKVEFSYFVFRGKGDDNAVYKVWNKCIKRFLENETRRYNEQDYSEIDDRIET